MGRYNVLYAHPQLQKELHLFTLLCCGLKLTGKRIIVGDGAMEELVLPVVISCRKPYVAVIITII